MKFLTNWKISLDKVPTYVEFHQDFKEEVDYRLANMILDCDDERLTDEIKNEFKKLVQRIDKKTNTLSVKYSPRHKLGRRYADCPTHTLPNGSVNKSFTKYYSALISQPRLIKNTIFKYQNWVDIDQQKGHLQLILSIAEKNGLELPTYLDCALNFDKKVDELSAYYSVDNENIIDKKDIKWLFNKTIYGGGHKVWCEDILTGSFRDHKGENICKRKPKEIKNINKPHPFYDAFYKETQKIISLIYLSNDDITKIVCVDIQGEQNEWKRKNRVMSYFCGIIENEITFKAYKYLVDKSIIQRRFCDWGLDGITFPYPTCDDLDFVISEMNDYVKKQTGLSRICFVVKPFDENDLLLSLIDERKNIVIEDEIEESEIDELLSFDKVSKEFEKKHSKITDKGIFIKKTENNNIVMSKSHLVTSYENMIYEKINDKGKIETCNFIKDWLSNNPNQLSYDDVGVYPNESKCPPNHFNMWRKFDMELVTEYTHNQEGLDFILNHLLILCDNDKLVCEYFIKWIGQMIQYPEVKTNCPTFISKEGAGKGTMMKLFEKMFGSTKVYETANPSKNVWGDFNGMMANAFLVNLNELSKKETLESEGKIKALITDAKLTINNKGVNQYDVVSYHRFIVSTNNEEPFNTSKDDRRKFVIRCSDELIGNKDYFEKIYKMLNDVNIIKSCYEYFKNLEGCDTFNKLPIPKTEYQEQLVEMSMGAIENWLKDFTIENEDQETLKKNCDDIFNRFNMWKSNNGVEYNCNSLKFMCRLQRLKISGITKHKTNKCYLTCFDIPLLKKHFGIGCLIEV